jgi:hypothetical protein
MNCCQLRDKAHRFETRLHGLFVLLLMLSAEFVLDHLAKATRPARFVTWSRGLPEGAALANPK